MTLREELRKLQERAIESSFTNTTYEVAEMKPHVEELIEDAVDSILENVRRRAAVGCGTAANPIVPSYAHDDSFEFNHGLAEALNALGFLASCEEIFKIEEYYEDPRPTGTYELKWWIDWLPEGHWNSRYSEEVSNND